MKVNGKDVEFKNNTNIIDLLNNYNLNKDRVVVEINFNIIDENKYENYIINKEDVIEIINFVGGG
ncbi:sulfur carrier protein ThiS [Clostridium sp. CCUG 7971]|uniref:sulfur carrier protein ThiS n=1 Tax=Clostridium sp. CCUG 7971 TaxID=2811414 RepID=UPI001ABAC837|nr:sulfur carrier protein ThiS [Clostridium sp. CCUG 7971]MBO3443543.1 sulfur carrier protein ThiS [Clostridium sp. CCUG 7971]